MVENQRYLALDVFRGMTVCFMIIVNTPGSWEHIYEPLRHATWHGFTPTDLVFPAFLFAVGNAMAFSIRKFENKPESFFWMKTIKRTIIIFLIGVLLYYFPFYDFEKGQMKPWETARIPGVLQRIALCYFFASIIVHYLKARGVIIVSVLLLVGYWIVVYAFGDANDPYSLAGFAGNDIDYLVFGTNHVYHGEGVPFDPEGLLSTIPAIVNVTIGYLVCDFVRSKNNVYEVIARLMVTAAMLIFASLCWHLLFPINKKIWTSSFVLLTTGISTVILCVLIFIIQILKRDKWTYFFNVFGKNPLFIYILSGILLDLLRLIPVGSSGFPQWLYRDFFGSMFSPMNASLLFALFYMLLNWSVGYLLDQKKIYIKV